MSSSQPTVSPGAKPFSVGIAPLVKRALISVTDKTGVAEFAQGLADLGWEIVSTGGTLTKIAGISNAEVCDVSEFTNMEPLMDDRIKTIHPIITGGILADRTKPSHIYDLEFKLKGQPFGLIVVNYYDFKKDPAINNIDIGGPTNIRAAGKNYGSAVPVVDPKDYTRIIDELKATGDISEDNRLELAAKAFVATAEYDTAIGAALSAEVARRKALATQAT
jgi:phosphoribosylaminoimidazolecarboxamide formyltransferase / IMP cyclohydrolase